MNLFTYKSNPGVWHCSVAWDDSRKQSLMSTTCEPYEAASKMLSMLQGEIPKTYSPVDWS